MEQHERFAPGTTNHWLKKSNQRVLVATIETKFSQATMETYNTGYTLVLIEGTKKLTRVRNDSVVER
jgi:hypothetical protein